MPISSSNPRLVVNTLDVLLKQCYSSPACRRHAPRRHYATGTSTSHINHEATDIAVLGGGITGLASAYFLSRNLPMLRLRSSRPAHGLGLASLKDCGCRHGERCIRARTTKLASYESEWVRHSDLVRISIPSVFLWAKNRHVDP